MKRTFLTNLFLLVGLNLLIKPFYLLVVESEIQNRVGPEIFGSYFALINFSFILNILLDLGTTNRNTRKIAHADNTSLTQLSGMIRLRGILALLYLAVSLIIGLILDYSNWQLFILAVLAFNQVLVSGIIYLRSYLTGMHLFRHDSLISIMDRSILLLMMGFMLWGIPGNENQFNIEWLVWGQSISYGLTFITAFILVKHKTTHRTSEDKEHMRLVLKESFPFAFLILISMIGYRVDSVMLERMAGESESGIYAMGYRFFEAVNMISYLFAVILLPMFSRMLNNREDVSSLLHLSFKILYSGVFIISIICWFNAEAVMELFYDHHTMSAAPAFSWLMISALFFSLQYVTGTLITASGNMRPMINVAIAGTLLNILLNLYYIPKFGATGTAIASCISQAFIFVGQIAVVRKMFDAGDLRALAMRTFLFTLLSIASCYAIYWILPITGNYQWILSGLAVLLFAVITRMLDFRSFLHLATTAMTKHKAN